jgi:hypothetical protein
MLRTHALASGIRRIRDRPPNEVSLKDFIALGEIISEIFPPESPIALEYKALNESLGALDNSYRESNLRTNIDRFKALVTATSDLIGYAIFPFGWPFYRPSRLVVSSNGESDADVVRMADHLFYESALFKAGKWVVALSVALVFGGAVSLGVVSVDLRKSISEVRQDIQKTIAGALSDMDQQVQAAKGGVVQRKLEFDAHVGRETTRFDTERQTRLDDLTGKIERELRELLRERSIAPASGRIDAAVDDFIKKLDQRKSTLDQNIDAQLARIANLERTIGAQESRLTKLNGDLENLLAISRPAQEAARTLASGTMTGQLALIGGVLELSVACLIGILILAAASFIVSLASAIALRKA